MKRMLQCTASTLAVVGMLFSSQAAYAAPVGCTLPNELHFDPYYNPFNKNSAHHRPIGTGAQYADTNHPSYKSWMTNKGRGFNVNVGAPWGVSLAAAGAGDGEKTIGPGPKQCDNVVGLPKRIRFPKTPFITPVRANDNGCPDGVVVIYDKVAQVPHQIRQYDWNNGNPVGGQYKTWDIKGLGHGTRMGDRVGTSAAGVAAMFGILRGVEINDPGRKIQHALQMVLPRKSGDCGMILSRKVQLPAVSGDGSMNSGSNNTGNVPYGALLALPPESKGGPDLDTLGLTPRGKILATAVREYGIYAVDGGACNALRADQYVTNPAELRTALSKIYPHIRMVLNNDNVLTTATAGGGAPLAPNCAFDGGGSGGGSSSGGSSSGGSSSGGSSGGSSSGGSGGGSGGGLTTMRIEVGGKGGTIGGVAWQADTGFAGGHPISRAYMKVDIKSTTADALYISEREGMTGYSVPVENGAYTVKLHFSENSWTVTKPGQRVFDMKVEDKTLANVDIYAQSPGKSKALIKTVDVIVYDDKIDIKFIKKTGSEQDPIISAIEVLPK